MGRQVFLGLVIGQSTVLSLASFNNYREPILSWTVGVGLVNVTVVLASGLMTYSLLGPLGAQLQVPTEFMPEDNKFLLVSC